MFKEEDLYIPIKKHFEMQGFKVNGEVKSCDVTAVIEDKLVVIELKKNLSVALLSQGVKRQKFSDAVYLAVFKPSKFTLRGKWKDIISLLKKLELGLLMVSVKGDNFIVEEVLGVAAISSRKVPLKSRKRTEIIKEIQGRRIDLNTGGSRGKKLVTAYRESSLFIAACLHVHGCLSPKQLKVMGSDEKKTSSILQKNYYGWFQRQGRGLYSVSEEGKKAINQYKELTEHFFGVMSEKR